jgi:hypothetical protein
MSEHPVSAVIIAFPKRHRAINAVLPAHLAPVSPLGAPRPMPGKPTMTRPLSAEPKISGLTTAPASTESVAPLARVISDLDAALTRQSAAVARWRTAIQDLRTAIDGLDGSLKQYRDRATPASSTPGGSKGATAS